MKSDDITNAIAAVEALRCAPTTERFVGAAAALAKLPPGTWVVVESTRYRSVKSLEVGLGIEEASDDDDTVDVIPW